MVGATAQWLAAEGDAGAEVDLAKAFDSVPHGAAEAALAHGGTPPEVVAWALALWMSGCASGAEDLSGVDTLPDGAGWPVTDAPVVPVADASPLDDTPTTPDAQGDTVSDAATPDVATPDAAPPEDTTPPPEDTPTTPDAEVAASMCGDGVCAAEEGCGAIVSS